MKRTSEVPNPAFLVALIAAIILASALVSCRSSSSRNQETKLAGFASHTSIPSGEPTRIHASDVTGSTNVATNEGAVADLSEFKRAVDPLTGEIASVDKDQKTVTAWAFDGKVLWSKNVVEEIPLFPTIGPPPEDFTNFFSTTNDRVKMLTPAERSEMRIGSIDFFKDYVCLRVDRAFVDLDKRTGEIKNSSMR
jgi:hypothetical protein